MERTCLKCGATNPQATGDASEACPTCGAIYSKMQELEHQRRLTAASKPAPTSGKKYWTPRFALVLLLLVELGLGAAAVLAMVQGNTTLFLWGVFSMVWALIVYELIIVVFDISETLQDCRSELQVLNRHMAQRGR